MAIRLRSKITRDSCLFMLGVLGVIYETLVTEGDRPTLLILFAACMGLPVFLNADEAKAKIAAGARGGTQSVIPETYVAPMTTTETLEARIQAEILKALREKQKAREQQEDTPP